MNVQEWVRIAVVPVPVQIVLLLLIFHKKPQNWKSGRFFVTLSNLLDLNERGTIISFILLDWGSYALLCFAFMFQLKIILVRLLGLRGTAPKFILCLSFFNYPFTLLNCCLLQKQQMPGASALTPKAVCLNIPIPVYPMLWSLITQRSVYGDDTSNHSSIALNNRHSLAKSSTSVLISNC